MNRFFSWKLARYKAVDLDFRVITPSLTEPTRLVIGMDAEVGYNCDHAGFGFTLALLFVWINFTFYDTRHRA